VQKQITYGFENALDYSRDDFNEDGHADHNTSSRMACWVCTGRMPMGLRDLSLGYKVLRKPRHHRCNSQGVAARCLARSGVLKALSF
jgi:hypothetical protein